MSTTNYPRKYWWVILIALPIIIALINIIPNVKKGGSSTGNSISIEGSTVEGEVQIIGTQRILNEIEQGLNEQQFEELKVSIEQAVNLTEGGFYTDAIEAFETIASQTESPAVYNNLGALYLLKNKDSEAKEALKQGIANNPEYKPLHVNLAQLYEKQGNVEGAITELEKASGEPNVNKRLKRLKEMASGGTVENEPNNTILEPNEASVSNVVGGYLKDEQDVDFYKIEAPGLPRDIMDLKVKNYSPELKMRVSLRGPNKQHIWSNATYEFEVTSGQDVGCHFSAIPGGDYYISVSSFYGKGRYEFDLTPQKAYDKFEPNDEIFSAFRLKINSSIQANILDDRDQDHYSFQATGNLTAIKLQNNSSGLQPRIEVKNAEKEFVWANANYGWEVTSGQNVSCDLKTIPGSTYYLMVSSLGGRGDYELMLSQ